MAAGWLLCACFFWAISFIATKVALETVPPLTVVALRLVISAACFAPWLVYKRIRPRARDLRQLFLLSLLGTGLHYLLQTIGLQYTTASNASLYAVTGPISILLISAVFLGERITVRKAAGITAALVGVLTVLGLETLRSVDFASHLWGDFLVFTSIFMWGAFTVYGKKLSRSMGAAELVGAATVIGALWMIPVGAWEMHQRAFSLAMVSPRAWGAIAFLGITCSFLATLLWFLALARTESQKVGVYLYTVPPMTYLAASIILDERIGLNLLAGSVLVIAGVYLTERG